MKEKKLKNHQKLKHSENESRPHACDVCSMFYYYILVLLILKTKIYFLPLQSCELTFKTENHLRSHKVMIHSTQQKKFQCALCGFKFHFKPELNVHMRVHTNDLPYKCPICSMSFKQLNAMKRHALLEHETVEIYKCNNCSEKFKTLNELKTHRQQHGSTSIEQKNFEDDQQPG